MTSNQKRWMISIPAVFVGMLFFLFHQKGENGRIAPTDEVIAALTLIVGTGIIFFVNWWGKGEQ
jgi:hypothetical protein